MLLVGSDRDIIVSREFSSGRNDSSGSGSQDLGHLAQSLGNTRGLPLSYANDHDLTETETALQLLQQIVYKASNSLLDGFAWSRVMEWIGNASYSAALEKMIKTPGPAMGIFTSNLLSNAIMACSTKVARLLLQNGVCLNSPIVRLGIKRSQRFRGSTKAWLRMARLLISFGADASLMKLVEDGQLSGLLTSGKSAVLPTTLVEAEYPARVPVETLVPDYICEVDLPGLSSSTYKPDHSPKPVDISKWDVGFIYWAVESGDSEVIHQWVSDCTHLSALLRKAIFEEDFATAKVIMDYGVENGMHTRIPDHESHLTWLLEDQDEFEVSLDDSITIFNCLVHCFKYYTRLVSREYKFIPWVNSLLQFSVGFTEWEKASCLFKNGAQASSLRGIPLPYDHEMVWGDGQMEDQVAMVFDLVDRGLDINSYDHEKDNISALSFGLLAKNSALVRFLLEKGARVCCFPPRSRWSPLHLAMQGRSDIFSAETAKVLISRGADVTAYEFICWNQTHKCSESETIPTFGYWLMTHLIDGSAWKHRGRNFLCFRGTPLQAACFGGHARSFRVIEQAGADVHASAGDGSGFTALQAAIHGGPAFRDDVRNLAGTNAQDEIVESLIRAGADVNAPAAIDAGFTALQMAILQKREGITKKLLNLGADIHCRSSIKVGCTALQAAVIAANDELVFNFLEAKANVNSVSGSEYGKTALQAACCNGNTKIVEALLDRGADVNAPPCRVRGATALQYAAMQGNLDLVVRLLEAGADINGPAAAVDGRTALEAASENGRLDVVQLLLHEDPDPDESRVRDKCHKAAELAEKESHVTIARILRDWKTPFCKETFIAISDPGFVNPQDLILWEFEDLVDFNFHC